MAEPAKIYRYTVTLTDGKEATADAMSYRPVDEWICFDDVFTTVYQVRAERVQEIARSSKPVGQQYPDDARDGEETEA